MTQSHNDYFLGTRREAELSFSATLHEKIMRSIFFERMRSSIFEKTAALLCLSSSCFSFYAVWRVIWGAVHKDTLFFLRIAVGAGFNIRATIFYIVQNFDIALMYFPWRWLLILFSDVILAISAYLLFKKFKGRTAPLSSLIKSAAK